MAYSKAKLKSNGDKASPYFILINEKTISLFQAIPKRKHARQILAYLAYTTGFIQTHFFLVLPVLGGCQTH